MRTKGNPVKSWNCPLMLMVCLPKVEGQLSRLHYWPAIRMGVSRRAVQSFNGEVKWPAVELSQV
jgi:hypothetical protein